MLLGVFIYIANIFPIFLPYLDFQISHTDLKIGEILAVQFFHISRFLLNSGSSDWQLFQMFFLPCSSTILLLQNHMFQFPKFYDLTLVLLTQRYVPFTFILKTNKHYVKTNMTKVELIEYTWPLWELTLCGKNNSGQRSVFEQCCIFFICKNRRLAGLD